ncbi:hypothetical protein QUF61_17750 [Candidatus Venteria ishoeyi]|uniref:hypothetical protein n=1 Tax=Candidatus Venteria ishoeyi TaxID=1899563 RepID=UPI0025A56FCE|nr:hypothetical protein [Candidatus Venteria ishoeyi]MDM8548338.1 hypothetical protein [Candidatus Venteria ishoeyi]
MSSPAIKPENFAESCVWYAIIGTYGFYIIGGLYILAPVLAWILLLHLFSQYYLNQNQQAIPLTVWVWISAMLVMEVALLGGHLQADLGLGKLIKSTIGWAKGWALLAIFPLLGACLDIRPALIYRAACMVGKQTLWLLPVFILAYILHLPETLYISPLKAVGGPGPEFFAVVLYEIDPGNGSPRWRFFTPWAPAAGFVANIYFIFALQETGRWRVYGILACLAIILMSKSRLALVAMLFVPISTWGLSSLLRPWLWFAGAFVATLAGITANRIINFAETAIATFKGARADSTRVRAMLGEIALHRWRSETPLWGHGIVESGPHLVEFMPIGSHHSWYGLLFVKGIVGFLALLVPMLWTFVSLLYYAQKRPTARVGLAMTLILFLYTFGENLEILAYLFWPALLLIGRGLRIESNT